MINDSFLLVITCQLEDESLLDFSYKEIIINKSNSQVLKWEIKNVIVSLQVYLQSQAKSASKRHSDIDTVDEDEFIDKSCFKKI